MVPIVKNEPKIAAKNLLKLSNIADEIKAAPANSPKLNLVVLVLVLLILPSLFNLIWKDTLTF